MRIALQSGIVPTSSEQFTEEFVAQIASLGVDGIACHLGFREDRWVTPDEVTPAECRAVRQRLEDHGLGVAYSWSFWSSLVNADPVLRAQAVQVSQGALRVARDLGAPYVVSGPGSNDPRGGWYPHPENFSEASLGRLIHSVREIAPAAEEYGVQFVLKGHTLSTLDTPEKMRIAVEAVDSPMVKSGADPVNCMKLEHVYDTAKFIRHTFDVLGDSLVIAHAKDVYLEPRLVLHLTETVIGRGWLDYRTYLRLFLAQCPDGWLVLEHLNAGDEAEATGFIDRLMREMNNPSAEVSGD